MEFHEKLQELRKNKGLTQEELAKELYVSRTAISKWESGRGYPSIDSLKEISKFFSVSIDDLLSSEELITAVQNENQENLKQIYELLFGITDMMHLILILLPLYPETVNGFVISVNLLKYTEISLWIRWIQWGLLIALLLIGGVKIFLNQKHIEKGQNVLTNFSMILSIVMILFLTMKRTPYAVTMGFLLLVVKTIVLFKKADTSN